MNKFFVENGRNIQSGLCLISAFSDCDYIGLTNIEFLDKENTIQEYKDWELETINTVITLSDYKQAPQKFRHEKICRVENIPYIAKVTFEENDYDLKEEEILNPFWGGLREVNYQKLINRLWDLESNDIWDYKKEIIEYYKGLFKKLEGEK